MTRWGKFLDPLADKILISSALISFLIAGYVKLWMVAAIILRDFIVTVIRSYMMLRGKSMVTRNIAKWKTFTQMGVIYLILIYLNLKISFPSIDTGSRLQNLFEDSGIIYLSMLFVTLFTIFSGLLYLVDNRGHLKKLALGFYRVFLPF